MLAQNKNQNLRIFSTLCKENAILLFSLFPLLPFRLKGLPVFCFFILSLFAFRRFRFKREYNILINSSIFLLNLISLIYSENLTIALAFLESSLSILVIPLSFYLISNNSNISNVIINSEFKIHKIFILSASVVSILIFVKSLNYGDYINSKIDLSLLLLNLDQGFFWLKEHAIYLSIYISISLLMIINLILKSGKKNKVLLSLNAVLQIVVLFLLSRKGVIISFVFASLIITFLESKNKIKVVKTLSIITGVAFLFLIYLTPDTIKRFKEVFDSKSYKRVENFSSTSIRFGIYSCSFEKINESKVIGFGIGDVQQTLTDCYEQKSEVLFEGKYNSHNQYLSILLSLGLLGFVIFVVIIIYNLNVYSKMKDYFATSLMFMFLFIMMFENILERQSGVILFAFFSNYYLFKNLRRSKET